MQRQNTHCYTFNTQNLLRQQRTQASQIIHNQVPPLTLQLLVENAVKHKRALPDEPLMIRIRTIGDGQLVVENNLQRRHVRVESNGVGLSNITDKYRLLGHSAPLIEETDGWFRVTLPLLTSQSTVKSVH